MTQDSRLSSTEDILKFLSRDVPAVPPGGLNFVVFVAAMERGVAGDRYLIGGPNWNFAKLFARLERLTKVAAPRLHPPGAVIEWGARAVDSLYRHWGKASPVDRISVEMSRYFWYLDPSKAERELGFRSRDPGDDGVWIRVRRSTVLSSAPRGTRSSGLTTIPTTFRSPPPSCASDQKPALTPTINRLGMRKSRPSAKLSA